MNNLPFPVLSSKNTVTRNIFCEVFCKENTTNIKINDSHGVRTGDASSSLDKASQAHHHSPHQMVVMEIKSMDAVFCLQLVKWWKAATLSTNSVLNLKEINNELHRLHLRAKLCLQPPAWELGTIRAKPTCGPSWGTLL